MLQTRVDSGLDGVIVADTVMSEVDGEAGRLTVRGHALEELVATRGFEGVAALLWDGYAEGGGDEAAVAKGLATARVHAFAQVPKLLAATRGLNPPKSNWATAIKDPPFWAYPVTGGITFTFGGLECSVDAEVVGVTGRPIQKL